MITLCLFASKDYFEDEGWNKNSLKKMKNTVDNANNSFIEYKEKLLFTVKSSFRSPDSDLRNLIANSKEMASNSNLT